jgi:hypothetical protein
MSDKWRKKSKRESKKAIRGSKKVEENVDGKKVRKLREQKRFKKENIEKMNT